MLDIDTADDCSSPAALAVPWITPPIDRSKSSAMRASTARRSSAACVLACSCSARSRSLSRQMILEDLQAARHLADLILVIDERDIEIQMALAQLAHDVAGLCERCDQTTPEPERDQGRDDQAAKTAEADPQRALIHDGVDVIDIDAGLDRQQLVAGAVRSDIRELAKLGAAAGARRQIFDEAAAGARGAHDVLDQELAGRILELPAVDVDVFRIAVNIGDAGVSCCRSRRRRNSPNIDPSEWRRSRRMPAGAPGPARSCRLSHHCHRR